MPAALAAVLRAKAAGAKSGDAFGLNAPMRDVFQYIDNAGTGFVLGTPNTQSGSEAGMGSSVTAPWETITHGAGDNAWTEQVPGVDPKFADVVRIASNAGHSNDGSGGWRAEVDGSKLPTTQYGDINRAAPVNAHTPLFDPRMVYDDPNYGRITDARNVKPDQINSMVSAALMSAAMAGMGYLGMPSFGSALVNGARSFGSGNAGGGFGSLLGAAGSYFGLPSWMTSAGRLALSQALRDHGEKT